MRHSRIHRRGEVWHATVWAPDGRRIRFSTKCTDRKAAELALARREREIQAAAGTPEKIDHTVEDALGHMIEHGLSDLSEETGKFYDRKTATLNRVIGGVQVQQLSRDQVQGYIDLRLSENVKPHTVTKELITLRKALGIAHDRGILQADPRGLFPRFRTRYEPRERHLSVGEFDTLMGKLRPNRKLWLLLACYSGGRRKEVNGLRWEHVDLKGGWLTLPGTKNKRARRRVPISGPLLKALEDAPRRVDGFVAPWKNPNAGLAFACDQTGVVHCSPNDLRRTFASWLKEQGVDSMVVAKLMGHSNSRMVEQVYGHLTDDAYRAAMDKLPRATGVSEASVLPRHRRKPAKRQSRSDA